MPNETIERIRNVEKECALRIQEARREADESIRCAESDSVLKVQETKQNMQMILRKSAADTELQAEKLCHDAAENAEAQAKALEDAAADKIKEAVSLVMDAIIGWKNSGER